MGLKERLQYPEVRAMLNSIYLYLDSYDFSPSDELKLSELRELISEQRSDVM